VDLNKVEPRASHVSKLQSKHRVRVSSSTLISLLSAAVQSREICDVDQWIVNIHSHFFKFKEFEPPPRVPSCPANAELGGDILTINNNTSRAITTILANLQST
jgi:hypothetical protein